LRVKEIDQLTNSTGEIVRPTVNAMIAAMIVSLAVGGCSSIKQPSSPAGSTTRPAVTTTSTPAGSTTHSAVTTAGILPCPARALVLHPGTYVSPMTGEDAVMYALTNRGSVICTLNGYPQAVLYDASGAVLPFRYTKGGGAYVTSKKPVTVVLARGASAYVLVAKYRCDQGIARNATAIRLTLQAEQGAAFTGYETVGLSYCNGGPHDPGQVIAVSPVEPTQQATSSLR
jgi:Domain of unknown function (DUF4232)